MPRVVYLPPDLTDGMRRRNGGPAEPEPAEPAEHDDRPGLFPGYRLVLYTITVGLTFVTLLALGLWKLAELVARALE